MITRFVTATGTGLGKTLVTAALCHQLRTKGKTVRALKPIVTGLAETPWAESDPAILLRSMGVSLPQALNTSPWGEVGPKGRVRGAMPEILPRGGAPHPVPLPKEEGTQTATLDSISPFHFAAPLAPAMAAAREGRRLDLNAVLGFCREAAQGPEEVLLIEGVGGVMVPLAPALTIRDWILALRYPAILVTGSYLGSLSHTLTALAVLREAALPVAGLVVSESEGSTVSLQETVAELQLWAKGAPVLALPRITGPEPWQRAPDLTALIS